MRYMETTALPRIVYAERVGVDIIIEFDDGESALYPAALLLAMLPQAVKIECSAFEEVESKAIS
jgi:hypothetical protein